MQGCALQKYEISDTYCGTPRTRLPRFSRHFLRWHLIFSWVIFFFVRCIENEAPDQWSMLPSTLLFPFIVLFLRLRKNQCNGWTKVSPCWQTRTQKLITSTQLGSSKQHFDYDLCIIGAGASGLFASGAASSLGSRTLLLEQSDGYVGGDCSNAACVPSKAMHSVARMAVSKDNKDNTSWLDLARRHSTDTVMAVRQREDPTRMTQGNPNLDLVFCRECHFVSPYELQVTLRNPWNSTDGNKSNTVTVTSEKFLIATGASPIVPQHLESAAQDANVPLYTYRSTLLPESNANNNSLWNILQEASISKPKNLVIAGGGPTACELGQSLARLAGDAVNITIVAPEILPDYDVSLRRAAMKLLTMEGITLYLRSRVTSVSRSDDERANVHIGSGRHSLPVDALLLCLGRSPEPSLSSLNLGAAGVTWNPQHGIEVDKASLRSKTAKHVYACGDCCDAVKERRAAHAAWTGFHAARNTILPYLLQVGSQAIHPAVPAVIYTDPQLCQVGLSYADCVRKYGRDGFQCLNVAEEGTDRADMDRWERSVIGFVELRATKTGKVLGMTACGPAAAELANEVGLAITSKLTVRDIARSIHSYPSHGYLLYRIALAMATSNILGLLSACGPAGKLLGGVGRLWVRASALSPRKIWRRNGRLERNWEADGSNRTVLVGSQDIVQRAESEDERVKLSSYLELLDIDGALLDNDTSLLQMEIQSDDVKYLHQWLERRPT